MITVRNPADRPAPATYHHGVEVSGPARTVYVAGQIGQAVDGTIPPGVEAQTAVAYANLAAVLAGAGMTIADVVASTVYLVPPADRAAFAAARARTTGGARHASTLVYVAGLAMPELLVEVAAVAVRDAAGDRHSGPGTPPVTPPPAPAADGVS